MIQKGEKIIRQFVVDERVYNGFLQTFNDCNPLHTDPVFAQGKGFKSTVMHGNILNGFLSYFVGECLPDKNVIIHDQNISYSFPVYLNDTLNFEAELVEVHHSVNAYEFKFFFSGKDSKKVAKGRIQVGLI